MAQRTSPTEERTVPPDQDDVPAESNVQVSYLDPSERLRLKDPLFAHVTEGQWRDTQQHSRVIYDLMMRDTAVSGAFNLLISAMLSVEVDYRSQNSSPSDTQQEMADFLNTQLKRINLNGTYRDGWSKFVTGFIQNAFQYGFGLAEIGTEIENWDGKPMVQLTEVRTLPQPTLDEGSLFGNKDVRPDNMGVIDYTCFTFNDDGEVDGYVQNAGSEDTRVWENQQDKVRILHMTHRGGDGNPFGQGVLWEAYWPWADKYSVERIEQWHLENAQSIITHSYDSDRPLPEVHKEFVKQLSQTSDGVPAISSPRAEFDTISTVDENYTDHVDAKIDRQNKAISKAVLVPETLFTETPEGDVDSRNLVQLFFKYRFPALLQEIREVLTWQLGKRLIDANYSNVEADDYPVARFKVKLDNDLRIQIPLLQQVFPYIDSDRFGEALEGLLNGFQREWVPDDHEDSVAADRPLDIHPPQDVQIGEDGNPPPKEEGETRDRTDGTTGNVGQEVDTEA